MINQDAIRLLDWHFQPDILKADEAVYSDAPEIIIAPSAKPHPIFNDQINLVFQRPFTPDETEWDYNCPDIEYYDILDIIFWRLGTLLDAEGLELSPAEFLREHNA